MNSLFHFPAVDKHRWLFFEPTEEDVETQQCYGPEPKLREPVVKLVMHCVLKVKGFLGV